MLVIIAVALEYYQSRSPRIIPEEQFAFVKWLNGEPEQDSIRLINLPLGRQVSKDYALDQTLGGYPQVEGLAARTPIEAYNYIDSNVILRGWRSDNAVHCFPANPQSYHANLDQVLVDGFSHIILHHTLGDLSVLLSSFVNVPPAYEDEYVMIYRVRDLRQSCDSTAWISRDALMQMRGLAEATVIVPETGSSILSLSDGDASAGDSSDSNSAVLFGLSSLVLLDPDDLNDTPAEHIDQDIPDPMTTLYSNSVVLLVYDPLDVAPDVLNQYRAALARQFHSCGRPAESSETVIEYFLLPDFPCELAIEPDPLTIRYDNGIQLGNLIARVEEDTLYVHLMWTTLPREPHAFSIQVFDTDDNRALGKDNVIGLEPAAHHVIDISSLDSGDYVLKMIVYSFDTGISVSGTAARSGLNFTRELEFARIVVE